jgi:hypothetical protein
LKRGLDAVVYVKLSRYLFFTLLCYCAFTFLILAPVHAFASPSNHLTGTASISMSNISGLVLIADVVGVYFSSIVASVFLYKLYVSYFSARTRYRVTSLLPENFVVLVREFDPTLTEGDLRDTFERIFPGKVKAIRKALRSRQLFKLLEEREDIGRRLEQAEAELLKKGERKVVRDCKPFFCCWGKKEDAILFFGRKFQELSQQIEMEQNNPSSPPETGCCFVTFKDRVTAQVAAQSILKHDTLKHPLMKAWVCDPGISSFLVCTFLLVNYLAAPSPQTVLWHNLWVPHLLRWFVGFLQWKQNFKSFFFFFFCISGFCRCWSTLQRFS